MSFIPPDRNLSPMTTLFRESPLRTFGLVSVASFLLATPVLAAPPQKPADTPAATTKSPEPDRSAAYYHYGLAHLYEEMAVSAGRPE